jgi:sec-independent protein translocase protein TatA
MFDDLFRGATPFIILAVVVLLFGATRLPALARSLGQSRNAFKAEMKKGEETGIPDKTTSSAAPTQTTAIEADSTAVDNDAAHTTNSTPQS